MIQRYLRALNSGGLCGIYLIYSLCILNSYNELSYTYNNFKLFKKWFGIVNVTVQQHLISYLITLLVIPKSASMSAPLGVTPTSTESSLTVSG